MQEMWFLEHRRGEYEQSPSRGLGAGPGCPSERWIGASARSSAAGEADTIGVPMLGDLSQRWVHLPFPGQRQAESSDPAQLRARVAGARGSPALAEQASISLEHPRGAGIPARLRQRPPASGGWAGVILEMSAARQPARTRREAVTWLAGIGYHFRGNVERRVIISLS